MNKLAGSQNHHIKMQGLAMTVNRAQSWGGICGCLSNCFCTQQHRANTNQNHVGKAANSLRPSLKLITLPFSAQLSKRSPSQTLPKLMPSNSFDRCSLATAILVLLHHHSPVVIMLSRPNDSLQRWSVLIGLTKPWKEQYIGPMTHGLMYRHSAFIHCSVYILEIAAVNYK